MGLKKDKRNIIVASESPDLYTTKRLLTEANKLKYGNSWLNPYQFLISTNILPSAKKERPDLYFHRTTGIRYDDFDLIVSQHHSDLGYKITNPLHSLETFRSKDRQMLFFGQNKLSSIESISYRGELNENYWESISTLSPGQKFIIKMVRGNQGIGVNLVNGLQSLKSLLETFNAIKDQKFIIQPFIEHKKEWRIFILKNEIIGIVERRPIIEDFRGNSKRSLGKIIKKISTEIQNEALRGVSLSGMDYCGVDIIDDGNNFYFLEFNPVPGFEQMEKLTGLNIARELITKL
ncbi:MAG: ATP-grasp domain-containing protein [Bacteriovorax sp.]|nr:ATP-grasp domain-containing protein [Bacteriovorax sp.]